MVFELGQPGDIREVGGSRHAKRKEWDQALAPGEDLAVVAGLSEGFQGVFHRLRKGVLEGWRLHLRASSGDRKAGQDAR